MRSYCLHCYYPESTCLCEHIKRISCPLSLIILQHGNEATHAKNTVRLVKLVIPDTRIEVGKTANDFSNVIGDIMTGLCGVVYPTENSIALDAVEEGSQKSSLKQLVFIDGSWRQAYSIWQANPWLHKLPQFHLNNAPASLYEIRHVKMDNSLSTLEAVSHSLSAVCGIDTSPLLRLQAAFQQKWRSPRLHRRK